MLKAITMVLMLSIRLSPFGAGFTTLLEAALEFVVSTIGFVFFSIWFKGPQPDHHKSHSQRVVIGQTKMNVRSKARWYQFLQPL